jgi:hypothetical protein
MSSCSCPTSPGPSRLHSSPSSPSAAPPSSPPSSARAPPEPPRTSALSHYCSASGNDTWFRFAFVQPDRSSLWCIISALTGGAQRDESLNDCIGYNLKVTPHCPCVCPCRLISAQRAPMELVSWPYKNSARHDMCACSPALCLAARCRRRDHAAATAAPSRLADGSSGPPTASVAPTKPVACCACCGARRLECSPVTRAQ